MPILGCNKEVGRCENAGNLQDQHFNYMNEESLRIILKMYYIIFFTRE